MTEYIISLTLLIAAVVLIRAVFRKKITPRMMYALWLVVLVRMLLPFPLFRVTLPETVAKPAPIEPIIEDTTPVPNGFTSDFVVQEQPETVQNVDYSDTFVPHEYVVEPSGTTPSEIVAAPETEASDEVFIGTVDTIPKVTEPTSHLSVRDILNIVWAVGAAVIFLWFAVSGAVFSHGLKKDRQLHSVVGKTKIYLSSGAGSPCVSGIIPVIYINPEAAENSDVGYIVKHEMTHISHGDNIWAIFRILALVAFWYNPAVWLAAFLSKRDAELAVDDSIAARLNEGERIEYARAILAAVPVKRGFVSGFGSAPLRERLLTLTKKRKTSVIALILAVVLTLSAVGCAFIGTKEKAPDEDIADNQDAEDSAKIESDYAAAVALYKNGSYKEARAAFYRLGDYRNSVRYYLSIEARPCKTVYKGQYVDFVSTVGYDEYGNILYRASDDVVEYKRDYTYDEKGRILTSNIEDHDDSMTETYTYTDSGYSMIRDTVSNGNTERYEQFFNDKDLCVKEIYRREDGSGFFIEYEFDGDGNFLKSYSADLTGNFISSYENEYDESGNVIGIIKNYYGNVDTYSRTYDEHGNITSDKHTFSDGTEEISERRYRYDEYGNIVYEVIRGEDGKTVTETTFEGIEPYGSGFCYGKKTVNTTYTSKNGSVAYSGKQVYDPSERLLYYFRDDGETQITEEYTYDVFGNPLEAVTEEKNLKSNKTERSSIIYTYDEDGNLIKYESTGDNKHSSTEEYSDFVYFVKNPLVFDEKFASEETKTVLLNTVTTATTPFGTHKYVNEYDEYGRLIKSTAYTDGEEFSVTEYTYDEYGCQNSEKYVSDEMSYTYEWTNNTDGNRLKGTEKTKQKSELSSFESEYEYIYDENGRVVSYDCTTVSKRAMIFGKTTTEQHRTYEYTDEYGSYIMKEWGDNIPETVYQYFYDENGNLDEEIVLTDGKETMRTKYDSHGYAMTVRRKTTSGEEVTRFENTYENDLLTKMIKKSDDGKIISTTVNTYDGDGKILSSVTTGENRTETSSTVYEYEEFEIKVLKNYSSPVNKADADALYDAFIKDCIVENSYRIMTSEFRDLDFNGVDEYLVYVTSGYDWMCEIFTIEDEEVRAFTPYSVSVKDGKSVPKAKNALEIPLYVRPAKLINTLRSFSVCSDIETGEKVSVLLSEMMNNTHAYAELFVFRSSDGRLKGASEGKYHWSRGNDGTGDVIYYINDKAVEEDSYTEMARELLQTVCEKYGIDTLTEFAGIHLVKRSNLDGFSYNPSKRTVRFGDSEPVTLGENDALLILNGCVAPLDAIYTDENGKYHIKVSIMEEYGVMTSLTPDKDGFILWEDYESGENPDHYYPRNGEHGCGLSNGVNDMHSLLYQMKTVRIDDYMYTCGKEEGCVELLRWYLTAEYEKKYGVDYAPLATLPEKSDYQTYERYMITNLVSGRRIGRFVEIIAHEIYYVDLYSHDIFMLHDGAEQTFELVFSTGDENALPAIIDTDGYGNISVKVLSGNTHSFVKSKRYIAAPKNQNAESSDAVQLAAIYDNIAGTYLTDYVFVLGNYGIQGVSTKENGEAEYLYGKQIVNNGTDTSEKVCIYKTDPFEILYDGDGMEWPTFIYDGERIVFYDSFRGRAHDVVSSDGKQLHTDDVYYSLDLLPDGNLILCGENFFTVYDMDFKPVHESKNYDYVLYDAQANYLYVRVDGKMMLTDAYETYLKSYEDENATDFHGNRKFVDITYNLAYLGHLYDGEITISGQDELDNWVNNVFLKKTAEEQDALPTLYQAVHEIGIKKDDLIALNESRKKLGDEMFLTDEIIDALYLDEAEMLQKLTVTNEQHVLDTSYPFLEINQFMDIFVRFFHDEYSKGDELKGNALYATALLCINAANNEHATFSIPESVDGRYGTISRRDLEYIAKKIFGEGVDLTKYHSTFTGTYDGYFPDEEAYHFGNGTDWWHDDPCAIDHDTVVIEEVSAKPTLIYSAGIDIYDEQFSDVVAESKYLTYTFKKVCDNELMYLRLVSIEDTASCEIVSERTPDFTDGMAAVECDVYPFPDDSTTSIGIMWLHKRVFVEAVATVRNTITGEVSDWYQISCTDKHGNAARFTGWVPASCVEKYDENASVPDNALYQIKMGAEYTIDGVTKTFDKDSMNVTMVLDRTEENGRMKFTAYGGSTVVVNSKDCVEQNDRLIPPRWANVP